jgi:hypothetical protein
MPNQFIASRKGRGAMHRGVTVAQMLDRGRGAVFSDVPASVSSPPRAYASHVGAWLLSLVGVALAVTGAVGTTAYSWIVGGLLFAALALSADALVLAMPSAIVALWRRRSPLVILAALLWLFGASITAINLGGFVGSRDDGFRAGRETQTAERALFLERMARLRHERALISEMRPVGELNVAIWNARRPARPALRQALAIAQRRDAVDAELLDLESKLPALPQITMNDPSAAVLSEITGATISENSLKRLRLALLLVLPLCGGLVLPVAIGLASERRG